MKTINWKIVLTDDNKIAMLETATGLPQDKVETHLTIIGLLENLKQKHLDKLDTLYQKTVRKGDENGRDL